MREGQRLVDRPQEINDRLGPGHVEIGYHFQRGNDLATLCGPLHALPADEGDAGTNSGPIAEEVYAWLGSGKIRSIATDRSLKWSVLNPWLVDLLKSGLVSMLLSRTAVGKRERSRT